MTVVVASLPQLMPSAWKGLLVSAPGWPSQSVYSDGAWQLPPPLVVPLVSPSPSPSPSPGPVSPSPPPVIELLLLSCVSPSPPPLIPVSVVVSVATPLSETSSAQP